MGNSNKNLNADLPDEIPTRLSKSGLDRSTPTKNARAASGKKAAPISKINPEAKDKIYELERENMNLKGREHALEGQIQMMKTKLRRIEDLFRKVKKNEPDNNVRMSDDLKRLLSDEIEELIRENASIKERNKKLRTIEQGIGKEKAKKPPAKKPLNKYSHVKGKLNEASIAKSDQEHMKLVEAIKIQLVSCEKQIIALTAQRDRS